MIMRYHLCMFKKLRTKCWGNNYVTVYSIAYVCSNGSGRAGTYILLDMVINRIHKGECDWRVTGPGTRSKVAKFVDF